MTKLLLPMTQLTFLVLRCSLSVISNGSSGVDIQIGQKIIRFLSYTDIYIFPDGMLFLTIVTIALVLGSMSSKA